MTHKQVLVVRKDLKMRRGKEISQCAHASLGVILNQMGGQEAAKTRDRMILHLDDRIAPWIASSFTKICVSVNSEDELILLEMKAKEAGLLTCLIQDNGRTEFRGVPTYTVLAIGPDTIEKVNSITSNLPLY